MSMEEFFNIKDSKWINVIKDSDILNTVEKYIDVSPYTTEHGDMLGFTLVD